LNSKSIGTSSGPNRLPLMEVSSVGSLAHSRLEEGGEGTIHGVFDGAINILLTSGLISLVPDAVQRGPMNITLRLPAGSPKMSSLGVRVGEKVRVLGSTLKFGNGHRIKFGSGTIYSPKRKFTLPALEKNEVIANLEVMRRTALKFGSMEGLGQLLALMRPRAPKMKRENLNIFATAALPRIVRLEQAFRSEQRIALTNAISELIGLGPGLTPSSDDMLAGLVLLGLLYSDNTGRAQRRSRLIAEVAAAEARGKTTLLSEEYLRQAASGRGNEPVMRLCAALMTGGRDSVERETRRVLAIGETSGTDTVLGIALGTKLCTGRQSGLIWREFE
jgi:Protein of unknown function (DUF2877)